MIGGTLPGVLSLRRVRYIMPRRTARVKAFSELSPATQKRYMRVLQVETPAQAQRILSQMSARGVSRKRLRGHAPSNVAKPVKKPKASLSLAQLRRNAAIHIARTLGRPDALPMLTLQSTVFDRPSALRALNMDDDEIRSAASRPPEDELDGTSVNPFWYHPTAYAYSA